MRSSWGFEPTTAPRDDVCPGPMPGPRVEPQNQFEHFITDSTQETQEYNLLPDGSELSDEETMRQLQLMKEYAVDKSINMTYAFQGYGGPKGLISKPRFRTTLSIAFGQNFPLTEELVTALSRRYADGPPGPYTQVHWKKFVEDVCESDDPPTATPPDSKDPRIARTMAEMAQLVRAEGLDMPRNFTEAGGRWNGVISKVKFNFAVTSLLFPHYKFSHDVLKHVTLVYSDTRSPPDHRQGGHVDVLWLKFAADIASL
mmetsp:Transcript_84428/g.253203  ORF Transcript_84428/g.253203 Transcript_84428/m.253203 type:complete len:257 (-) Transcript_84428:311-1081(-)